MYSLRRFYFIVVLLGFTIQVNSKSTNGHPKNSLISETRQGNTTASNHTTTTKRSKDANVRKTRSPQFTTAFNGLNRPGQIGLGQIGLPYSPRLTPLALQGTPNLQALGQNIIPNNALIANGYRLPYNYRLASLLSTINLLRERSALASAVNPAVLNYIKPKRLKYDSIPIKPDEYGGGLNPSALSLLLGRSSLGTQATETQDDEDDTSDTGK